MVAERDTTDRLIAHFLADRIGATFEGRITGVTRAGLFVRLNETGADGFVPARTIGDEYFRYDEDAPRAGRRAHRRDLPARRPRQVKLVEAAPVAGALRFELLSEGRRGAVPRNPRHDHGAISAAGHRTGMASTESTMTTDIAKRLTERMTKSERDQSSPDSEPRDAATLMLIDRSGKEPKILLGRRHASQSSCRESSCFRAAASRRSTGRCPPSASSTPTPSANSMSG